MAAVKVPCQECGKEVAQSHMRHHLKTVHAEAGEAVASTPIAPEPKEPSQDDRIFDILNGVADELKSMRARIEGIEAKDRPEALAISKETAKAPEVVIDTTTPDSPTISYVPVNVRKVVDEILGEDFKVEVYADSDLPQFNFSVIVPERFGTSTVMVDTKSGREAQSVEDRRSRVISNAEGVNGVREWCQKVRQNLLKHQTGSLNTK